MSRETEPGGKGKTNFGRDLFSIQLEVTEKLLEAEEKKLRVLKAEIEASKHMDKDSSKVKELQQQEANYVRIKMQQQRLAQEMQDATVVSIIQKRPKMKASRSLPAMVLKSGQKTTCRPSVFDHLVPRTPLESPSKDSSAKLQSPRTLAKSHVTPGQYSHELVYQNGVLMSGSLEALIDLLCPTPTTYPDRAYVFAFILCSRLFLRPYELLGRVLQIFHIRQKQLASAPEAAEILARRINQLMEEWTETFPYDFRDERMMRSLKEMTQACMAASTDLRQSVGQVQSVLVKRLSVLDKYEHILSQVNMVAMERLIDPKTQVNIQLVCEDPATLAQQLTHIELERLNNIGPEEFIQAFVKHPSETEPLYRDMKQTCNIEAYVEWFNRLSYLVATEILVADKKRNRAKLIEFFADTANECRKVNNFNSSMAISAGLFMSSVTRLRKTMSRVSSSKIQSIEDFVDPISNFSTYRVTLEKAIGQADKAKDGPHSWVVPFFSLIVKDIYFLHQGMSDMDVKGFIRFDKCMSLARLVSQILNYKDRVLPFPRSRNVLNYLMTIPVHTDDELQLASYEIEPPEHPGEKKRYQELKSVLGSFGGRISRPNSTTSSVSSTSPPISPTFPTIHEET